MNWNGNVQFQSLECLEWRNITWTLNDWVRSAFVRAFFIFVFYWLSVMNFFHVDFRYDCLKLFDCKLCYKSGISFQHVSSYQRLLCHKLDTPSLVHIVARAFQDDVCSIIFFHKYCTQNDGNANGPFPSGVSLNFLAYRIVDTNRSIARHFEDSKCAKQTSKKFAFINIANWTNASTESTYDIWRNAWRRFWNHKCYMRIFSWRERLSCAQLFWFY